VLIPLRPPKSDAELLNNDYYRGYFAHPFTLFERCDHTACGKLASHYLLWETKSGGQRIGSRCSKCLPLVKPPIDVTVREITKDEAVIFVAMAS
jgi:hypothetical protein